MTVQAFWLNCPITVQNISVITQLTCNVHVSTIESCAKFKATTSRILNSKVSLHEDMTSVIVDRPGTLEYGPLLANLCEGAITVFSGWANKLYTA